MGNSGSKAARATGSTARQYPKRAATQTQQPPYSNPAPSTNVSASSGSGPAPAEVPGAQVHPEPQAYGTRNEAVDLDARDPQFASRLSELGPVKPYPTYSPSSTVAASMHVANAISTTNNAHAIGTPSAKSGIFPAASANPAVAILAARQRLQDAVEQERIAAGRTGFQGKQFVDVATIRKILTLRDEQGMKPADIERALGLRQGLVQELGTVGVVEVA